ncbi:hypothetical protein OG533_23825 [Streptomyces sp. NBC_01186]|uniref:hypothetical protein n=1 Tax=Streptomyces sp. NBC_01186 TaxID=2903765 RepID=UPI002E0F40FB|nr:hypothetical protein OG533_23825 [Streptomyces sp. NBC_01186]
MAITEETTERLRVAATAGDPDAARELGRLSCMLRSDSPEHLVDPDFLLTWPEEPWLRAALRIRPDDRLAAVLLAGRLVQQSGPPGRHTSLRLLLRLGLNANRAPHENRASASDPVAVGPQPEDDEDDQGEEAR